jgi:hypothetical protein
MSVNINTVYQTTLSILNKEQRGYLTPQQFNLFANQAQLDLFEQYFYDINQFGRVSGNSTEYSDMLNILNEKISPFEVVSSGLSSFGGGLVLPTDLYRLGTVIKDGTIECERLDRKEFLQAAQAPLAAPTNTRPVYMQIPGKIQVYGKDTTAQLTAGITCNYIKKPATPTWGYNIVFGEALYNAGTSTDFELHPSEETELVIKILELAGIAIEDIQLYQIAAGEELKNTQQEKA